MPGSSAPVSFGVRRRVCPSMGLSMSEAATAITHLVDIAVLDDDADFLTYIEDLLRDEGFYSVRTFAGPEKRAPQAPPR